jgi:transposase-like protein
MNANMTTRLTFRRILQGRVMNNGPAELGVTLADLNREFPNDDACLEFIKEGRWPNNAIHCKKCNAERKHSRVSGRTAYACGRCGNHIYPLKGTVFARSSTSLKTWFYVMCLFAASEGGITAKKIQREAGVTYKTAWRMLSRLREFSLNKQKDSSQSVRENNVLVSRG